ncbi:MAG: alpha-L-rhamnosidase [Clostridia bacterium]|nr:alpha-L-rhamnosidase [Clostridia bacterium]
MIEYIFPKRVIAADSATCEKLFLRQPLQIGLGERQTTSFFRNDFIILDFGAELCGGIRILAYRAENIPVRIRFGESMSECCSELGGPQNSTNDHSLRDFTVYLQNYSDMSFGQSGFRFVRLDFGGEVEIKSVVAVSQILKKKSRYCYKGNDEQIRAIYESAKRTVDLCASGGYVWDGIKRDRLVWVGDMAPEVLALTTLYGRLSEVERSLDYARKQFPLPGWMNTMPTYSLWWIIILADYYERTGAKAFASRQIPYLLGLIQQINACVDENGELHYPSYFVDWPTHGQVDEKAGVRAINIYAMKRAVWLLHSFGYNCSLVESILARLRLVEIEVKESKQVLGLKFFATELSETDKKRLIEGGARGMSTFMSYYILKAVASFDKPRAVAMMKEYYGGMLDKGATTFWEDFDIAWLENSSRIDELPRDGERDIHGDFGAFCYIGFRHSLCHGWSAGVISFMEEECL